jgi:hypothetical protein
MCLFQFNLYLYAFAMRIGTSALLLMIHDPAQGKSHALATAHHNSLRGGIRTLCTLDASLDRVLFKVGAMPRRRTKRAALAAIKGCTLRIW